MPEMHRIQTGAGIVDQPLSAEPDIVRYCIGNAGFVVLQLLLAETRLTETLIRVYAVELQQSPGQKIYRSGDESLHYS